MVRKGVRRGVLLVLAALCALPATAAAANADPECRALTHSVAPGASRALALECVDPDQGPNWLDLQVVSQPAHGTLDPVDNASGTVRYTPDAGFTGDDALTYRATDGAGESAEATIAIRVTSANQAPVCPRATLVAYGDAPSRTVCHDPDAGDAPLVELVAPPAHGTVRVEYGGAVSYVPEAGYVGSDAFTVRASDGTLTSAPSTIPVYAGDRGIAACDPLAPLPVRTGTDHRIDLRCTDASGQQLGSGSFEEVEPPAHGTLRWTAFDGGYVYTPDPGFTGTDTATLRPLNGRPGDPVDLTFEVSASANTAPRCTAVPQQRVRPGRVSPSVLCTDADGDDLTYTLLDEPDLGTYTAPADGWYGRYVAAAGTSGLDTFSVQATDGRAPAAPVVQTVRVIGAAEDFPPECAGLALRAPTGVSTIGWGRCVDPEADPFAYAFGTPAHGALTVFDGELWRYRSDAGYTGADATTYTGGGSLPADLRFELFARSAPRCPRPPTLRARTGRVAGRAVDCAYDDDPPTYTLLTPAAHGTAVVDLGAYRYTSDPGYDGPDAFVVRATDAGGTTDITVNVDADPDFNTVPDCGDGRAVVTRQMPVTLALPCVDGDADPLTKAIVDPPAHGTLSAITADGTVTYTPAAGYVGNDAFTFRASDGRAASPAATQKVVVRDAARNSAPYCFAGGPVGVVAGTTASQEVVCEDPDGDALTYEVTDNVDHGTLTGPGPRFTYAPAANVLGADQATVLARDARGAASAPVVIRFEVSGTRGDPTCSPIAFAARAGEPQAAQLSCAAWGPGGPGLTYEIVAPPTYGTVSTPSATGAVTYTADPAVRSADTFTYRAREGDRVSAPVTATVTVTGIGAPPVVPPGSGTPGGPSDTPPPGVPPSPLPVPPTTTAPNAGPPGITARVLAPAEVASRALGGRVVRARRIGDVSIYRRTGTVRLRGSRVPLLALVCATRSCSATATPSGAPRQRLVFTDTRAGIVSVAPRRLRRGAVTVVVGRTRATITVPVRR